MNGTTSVGDQPVNLAVHSSTRWSTRIELVVTDRAVLVAARRMLEDELDRVERVASRFRHDSEVRRLSRDAIDGVPIAVSPELVDLLTVAMRAAKETDGAVDPTVGSALCLLGYDRDFAQVAGSIDGTLPDPTPVTGWRSVHLDAAAGTVTLPAATLLDLGATAKALTADRAATAIADQLRCGVLVSLGGDVSVQAAPSEGFAIGVADVCGAVDAQTSVTIRTGGLASSGTSNRHWNLGGVPVHHVVDPATGRPVTPCWRTVTVAADSCVGANTASTAALVLGEAAPAWLDARHSPSRLVRTDGSVVTVAGWPDDVRPVIASAR